MTWSSITRKYFQVNLWRKGNDVANEDALNWFESDEASDQETPQSDQEELNNQETKEQVLRENQLFVWGRPSLRALPSDAKLETHP